MESRLVTVATCNLNQWALDFDGNCARILESCRQAKAAGASYRLGPELELSGYGCEDHFYELDTIDHCWESLATLFRQGATDSLLCDFGMPLLWQVRVALRVTTLETTIFPSYKTSHISFSLPCYHRVHDTMRAFSRLIVKSS